MRSTVAVTGATGCVGTAFVRHLVARGVGVRALLRAAGTTNTGLTDVHEVRGDLLDPEYLAGALEGVDVVVHLAARAHTETRTTSPADYDRINVRVSERLYLASRAAGVHRFVFASSDLVMGEAAHRPLREDQACRPDGAYALSKHRAERSLQRLAAGGGPSLVVLRPSVVYGEGDRGSFARLFRAIARRRFVLPWPAHARLSVCYAGNLALAIELAAAAPAAAGRTYLVSDEPPPTLAEIAGAAARAIATATGQAIGVRRAPARLLYPVAVAGDLLQRYGVSVPLTTDSLRRLTTQRVHDLSRIRSELDYRPRYSLTEGFERTARWLFSASS